MDQYLKTRYPGIFNYIGKNGAVYGIDYKIKEKQRLSQSVGMRSDYEFGKTSFKEYNQD